MKIYLGRFTVTSDPYEPTDHPVLVVSDSYENVSFFLKEAVCNIVKNAFKELISNDTNGKSKEWNKRLLSYFIDEICKEDILSITDFSKAFNEWFEKYDEDLFRDGSISPRIDMVIPGDTKLYIEEFELDKIKYDIEEII